MSEKNELESRVDPFRCSKRLWNIPFHILKPSIPRLFRFAKSLSKRK